ncbi:hypothetical protein GCM10027031_09570 [Corynebacterium atrinae]
MDSAELVVEEVVRVLVIVLGALVDSVVSSSDPHATRVSGVTTARAAMANLALKEVVTI